MKIIPVPVLSDNYAYLLVDQGSQTAAAVDPAEPDTVIRAAQAEGVQIVQILTTHKHWDHSGGNSGMASQIPGIEVVGGSNEGVDACTKTVQDNEEFTFGDINIRCMHTPGHTMGHICYYVTEGEDKAVFTGDTLFIGGAGKFFEGTAEDMYPSLYQKLGALPTDTKVYCGHEYTLSNYRFALHIDPDNAELQSQNAWARQQVNNGLPTVPSTIANELATNPFMRATDPSLQEKTGKSDPIQCLAAIRQMKNRF
mmetsp:Transcript_7590/g.10110  ORF Transcript_7590/g.10110 Transcript_7590/m.10110 type:complete len:254 (+) Transcript_7590:158-919(+)